MRSAGIIKVWHIASRGMPVISQPFPIKQYVRSINPLLNYNIHKR